MLAVVSNKTIGEERNSAVRAVVRGLIEKSFEGDQAAAAKAFGVSPSLVSEFLSGKRGAGMKLLDGIAAYTGRPIDEIVRHRPAEEIRVEYDERYPNRARAIEKMRDVVSAEAIRRISTLALSSPRDPDVAWWVRRTLHEEDTLKLESEFPDAAAERRRRDDAKLAEWERDEEARKRGAEGPDKGPRLDQETPPPPKRPRR
jgi:transcriptional regulator with XRE-family HTH domain